MTAIKRKETNFDTENQRPQKIYIKKYDRLSDTVNEALTLLANNDRRGMISSNNLLADHYVSLPLSSKYQIFCARQNFRMNIILNCKEGEFDADFSSVIECGMEAEKIFSDVSVPQELLYTIADKAFNNAFALLALKKPREEILKYLNLGLESLKKEKDRRFFVEVKFYAFLIYIDSSESQDHLQTFLSQIGNNQAVYLEQLLNQLTLLCAHDPNFENRFAGFKKIGRILEIFTKNDAFIRLRSQIFIAYLRDLIKQNIYDDRTFELAKSFFNDKSIIFLNEQECKKFVKIISGANNKAFLLMMVDELQLCLKKMKEENFAKDCFNKIIFCVYLLKAIAEIQDLLRDPRKEGYHEAAIQPLLKARHLLKASKNDDKLLFFEIIFMTAQSYVNMSESEAALVDCYEALKCLDFDFKMDVLKFIATIAKKITVPSKEVFKINKRNELFRFVANEMLKIQSKDGNEERVKIDIARLIKTNYQFTVEWD